MTRESITTTPGPQPAKQTCPECGARRKPGTKRCWMCHEPLPALPPEGEAELARRPPQPESMGTVALWFFIGIIGVPLLIGLILNKAYGVLIFLLIMAVPCLIGMAINPGAGGSSTKSVLGCLATVAIVGFCMIIAFGISCAVMLKNMNLGK
ncbi:MAG: hypothetical protein U0797_10380 [Gemmataceae bacterium]